MTRLLLCEDGDAVRLDDDGLHRDGGVPGGYLFVDGSTVGDIGHGVLRDRMVLAEEGVVMAVATVDLKRGEVVGAPQIITRGWAYDDETDALLDQARQEVRTALEKALADGSHDHETLNRVARKALGRLVGQQHQAAPHDRPGHRHRLTAARRLRGPDRAPSGGMGPGTG